MKKAINLFTSVSSNMNSSEKNDHFKSTYLSHEGGDATDFYIVINSM